MKIARVVVGLLAAALLVMGQSAEKPDEGHKAEQRSCTPCHSLRLVESQRLSAAAWEKEVDKMMRWGAEVPERQVLIDYLSRTYGTGTAPPPLVISGEGNK
jgi:hypothetical protein